MADIEIHDLSPEAHVRLRQRAARAGRSLEAEARAILEQACADLTLRGNADSLQDLVADLYGERWPAHVVETLIAERRREATGE